MVEKKHDDDFTSAKSARHRPKGDADAGVFAKTLVSHTQSIESIKESQAMIDAKLDRLLESRTVQAITIPVVEQPPSAVIKPVPAPTPSFLSHFFKPQAAPKVETAPKIEVKAEGWFEKLDIITLLAFCAGLMLGLGICMIVFVALRF
jgi:hypothetical protein